MLIIQKVIFFGECYKMESNSPLQKQAIDELNMTIFSSGWNRFVHISIVASITQNTKFILAFK